MAMPCCTIIVFSLWFIHIGNTTENSNGSGSDDSTKTFLEILFGVVGGIIVIVVGSIVTLCIIKPLSEKWW